MSEGVCDEVMSEVCEVCSLRSVWCGRGQIG